MRTSGASNLAGWVFADLLLAIALIFMSFGAVVTQDPAASPLRPPRLVGLSLTPSTVTGGGPVTATITLDAKPDGKSQLTVGLSTSNRAVATVGATVDSSFTQTATSVVTTNIVTATTPVTITAALGGVTQSAALTVIPQPLPPDQISLNSICRFIHIDGAPAFSAISKEAVLERLRVQLADLAAPNGPRAKLVLTFGVTTDGNAGARLSTYVNDLLRGPDLRSVLGNLLLDGDALQARNYWSQAGPGDLPGDVRIELFVQLKPDAPTPPSTAVCH